MAADIPEVTTKFGAACRSARLRLEYTQGAVVALLKNKHAIDLQPTALTRIENGTRDIKYAEALALSQILGVPIGAAPANDDVLSRLLARTNSTKAAARATLESAMTKLRAANEQVEDLEEETEGAQRRYEDSQRAAAIFSALNDLALGRKAQVDDSPRDVSVMLAFGGKIAAPDEVAEALVAAGANRDEAYAAVDAGNDRALRQQQLSGLDEGLASAEKIAAILRGLSGLTFARKDGWIDARTEEQMRDE